MPKWPAYTQANDAHMEFGHVVKAGSGLHSETFAFWDTVFGSR
jgi:hypothetical protein